MDGFQHVMQLWASRQKAAAATARSPLPNTCTCSLMILAADPLDIPALYYGLLNGPTKMIPCAAAGSAVQLLPYC
jgi:hypothetical protein